MPRVEMSHIDLEYGGNHRRYSFGGSDGDSLFYSTADGSHDACASDIETSGVSEVAESDCSADIENGVREIKVNLGRVERDCRICHLSLESTNPESGIAIELGCSCKDDLAAAHKSCAEAWFKIKGNKTCEICNSVARNLVGANDIEASQQTNDANVTATNAVSAPVLASAEMQRCLNGHRLVNFLLACMVFAFIISWLFHFNIPS